MTGLGLATPGGAPAAVETLAASASVAIGDLLAGSAVDGHVLGVFDAAVYVAVPQPVRLPAHVIAVVSRDGVALPNALVVDRPAAVHPFVAARAGRATRVGAGAVDLGELVVTGVRWWDPRPRLPQVGLAVLRRRMRAMECAAGPDASTTSTIDIGDRTAELTHAATALDGQRVALAARGLVGAGSGLTPAGDDVLAGLLATLRLLPSALPNASWQSRVAALADRLGEETLRLADRRTTALSAALLRHAARGEVAGPVARLLLALTGRGDVAGAARRLRDVGHTSGEDLLEGIRIGTAAVLRAASAT